MNVRGGRLWTALIASALLVALGGLAFAEEGDPQDLLDDPEETSLLDEGDGPPWLRFDVEGWLPGDGKPPWAGGPPPWADGSDGDGNGPPWVGTGWSPGDGKPPWAGGPPPWAGNGNGVGAGSADD
jgi:hypothetical protein